MKIYQNYRNSNHLLNIKYLFNSNRKLLFNQNIRKYNVLKTFLSKFPKIHPQNECEIFWSKYWLKLKLFSSPQKSSSEESSKVFSLLLPPPNITGCLHLGHALTVSIQDSICRHNRMKGIPVVWIPGLDHAGIATQLVVEKLLWAKERKTRHDLSREELLSRVNEWKNSRSDEIREQLLKLGASLDFDQEFFTLSETMSEAVNEAFIRLFNNNLIYRDSLLVNWSFFLQSTISDIEVKYQEISEPTLLTIPGFEDKVLVGVMHRFNYPIEGNDGKCITIATTRLETILGDVAVAVHPEDNRYSHLIGKNVINPLNGKKLPIIGDLNVKPDFGTGALKITPGHSLADYSIGKRNSLPIVDIFDDFGRINCPNLPQFHGIHRFKAKTLIRDELQNKGLYCGQSDHKHAIPLCSRSGDLIEWRRVPQWFLKCDAQRILTEFVINRDSMSETDLNNWNTYKDLLIDEEKDVTIIPPNYRNTWKDWFSRYQDWCISRQIFWGHQIPAYNIIKDGQITERWVAAKNKSEALSIAKTIFPSNVLDVKQDNDVLDTWFSSALLPLTINGWPKESQLKHFPLSLMETGHDIIFFWVARMILMSLALESKLPFNRVLLHGMVCDSEGKKMSKSKGNVIDPNDVINGITLDQMKQKNIEYFESGLLSKTQLDISLKGLNQKFPNGIPVCGADALRFSLLQLDFKEENVNFGAHNVIANKNFCNKIHQSVNFFISNIDNRFEKIDICLIDNKLSNIDRWILSCLVEVIKKCNSSFVSYDLQYATHGLKNFWITELCDVYLEHIKPIIYGDNDESRNCVLNVLLTCLQTSLRAIHPFMPFISENLYQHLMNKLCQNSDNYSFKSICDEKYPDISSEPFMVRFDYGIQNEMKLVKAIVKKIRWFTAYFKVPKSLIQNDILIALNDDHLETYLTFIKTTSKVNRIKFISLHEIHKYNKHFCYKIEIEDKDKEGLEQNSDQIYVLFGIDYESICESMSRSGIKPENLNSKSLELKEFECQNFYKNYKKKSKVSVNE